MAATIVNGEEHHFVNIWEGNGGGQRVGTFVPFTDDGSVGKSIRFNRADDPSLVSDKSGITPDSDKKFTFSCWFKLGDLDSNNNTGIFNSNSGGASGGNVTRYAPLAVFHSSNYLFGYDYDAGGYNWYYAMNRTLEDQTKWYHFVIAFDTTQSTDTDRMKIYIDGEQISSFSSITYPGQNQDLYNVMAGGYHVLGLGYNAKWDGYFAEVNLVENQMLTPATFGVTDTTTGRWIPKSLAGLNYGTNGFRLQFANTAGQAIGDDTSGNTKDFGTVNNLVVGDLTLDSPTNNFMTFQENGQVGSNSLAEGGLKPTFPSGTSASAIPSSLRIPVGKWYFEYYIPGTNSVLLMMAVAPENTNFSARMHTLTGFKSLYPYTRSVYESDATVADTTDMPLAEDDTTYGVYIERKSDGTVNYWVGDDQASKGTFAYSFSGNPATGANPIVSLFNPDEILRLFCGSDGNGSYSSGVRGVFNFGQLNTSPIDGGTALTDYTSTAGGFFRYQPASDFKALSVDNFPETTKGKPDFMQIKNRDATDRWCWQDSLRGFGEYGSSASASPGSPVQFNSSILDGVQKSLKGGFSIEDSDYVNSTNESYVSFNWVANNGVSATDSSGNMPCELQANPTAGFSIAKFTVNGTGVRTWAHGLGAVPEFGHLWVYNSTTYGTTYHHKMSATPAQNYLLMSSSQAIASFTNGWGTSGPSSSLWSGTEGQLFSNGVPYMFYSWVGIEGYSKFGTYIGNGSASGTFVYTGFKPKTIWIKGTGSTSQYIFDSTRTPNNTNDRRLVYDGTYTEASESGVIFTANGFKLASTSSGNNGDSVRYVYGAWAEHPFFGADGKSIATAYG